MATITYKSSIIELREEWFRFDNEKYFWEQMYYYYRNKKLTDFSFVLEVIKNKYLFCKILEKPKYWKDKLRNIEMVLKIIERITKGEDKGFIAKERDIYFFITQKKRVVMRKVITIAVDLDKEKNIQQGNLTLELVSIGTGEIYPIQKEHIFLRTNRGFDEAIENIKNYFKQKKLWPKSYDIRWKLEKDDNKVFFEVDSAISSAAFAVGVWKLLKRTKFKLEKIALVGVVDEKGQFSIDIGLLEPLKNTYFYSISHVIFPIQNAKSDENFLIARNFEEAVCKLEKTKNNVIHLKRYHLFIIRGCVIAFVIFVLALSCKMYVNGKELEKVNRILEEMTPPQDK